MKTGNPGRTGSKKRAKSKISAEAKKLILGTLRRTNGNQREAARRLGLRNNAQLMNMLSGRMYETPEMKLAVARANARARRAFLLAHEEAAVGDMEQIRKIFAELKWNMQVLENCIKGTK
jgi:hypothetical protein